MRFFPRHGVWLALACVLLAAWPAGAFDPTPRAAAGAGEPGEGLVS